MSRLGPAAIAVVATLALPAVPSASAAAPSPDRVIVEWAVGTSSVARRAARDGAAVDYARDLGSSRFQLVETDPGQTPRQAVGELEADPAVVNAEPDGYYRLDSIPDDPLFGQLWGLQNAGLGIGGFANAVAGDDIDVAAAWERTVGTPGTVVADIDAGYRFEHPDLANVAWTNSEEIPENGLDDDADGIVDDVHGADFVGPRIDPPTVDGDPTDDDLFSTGHGIHTAGTIGAEGNNGIGIVGVAQGVSIMPLRVCSRSVSRGESGLCPFSALVEAINYAGSHGARVANISIGGESDSPALADALAANPQTLFVIAAGNEGEDDDSTPHYPCVYDPPGEGRGAVDNVICVAATDQADQRAEFSNWGADSVDLGAPGTEILSVAPYRYFVNDDFEADDFEDKWTASGPDGGFARTAEAPLESSGISDSPGAAPVAGSIRASTSAPVTIPAGYKSCTVEMTRWVSRGQLSLEVDLDGEMVIEVTTSGSGHFSSPDLGPELSGGGELTVRLAYKARTEPDPGDGAWVDDVRLRCIAKVGEAQGYRFAQGTSMAAPHVTGAAALLFSLKPDVSVTEVRQGLLGSVDPVPSLAGKTTSGGRLDAGAATALFDLVPPPIPVLTATDPPSPSQDNQPRLIGSAQRGTSVDVYANATCSGSPLATASASQLTGPGVVVAVADGTVNEFSARATDMEPLTSECSQPISYTESSDVVPPAPPQLTATDPASPNVSGTPRVRGSAEAGSTVRVYVGAACSGLPVATGSAAALESSGIAVQVDEGVTADFSATATDAGGNASECSQPISYTRERARTNPGGVGGSTNQAGGDGGAPPASGCVVPKLAGKTPARAKAALAAAACKLGKVRKPRSRRGRRRPPLVVKSFSPAAGAMPGDGKVNLVLGPKPRKPRR